MEQSKIYIWIYIVCMRRRGGQIGLVSFLFYCFCLDFCRFFLFLEPTLYSVLFYVNCQHFHSHRLWYYWWCSCILWVMFFTSWVIFFFFLGRFFCISGAVYFYLLLWWCSCTYGVFTRCSSAAVELSRSPFLLTLIFL